MRVLASLEALAPASALDVLVVGAGGAGLCAALCAAIDGAQVLLVESTGHVGGTTALSAGTVWIPGTHHAATVNPDDTLADAARYLDNAIGDRAPRALRQAFLEAGAGVVQHLEAHSELRLRPYAKHPDYISDLAGATLNGRALEPVPFDGRLLGDLFRLLRPPIPEFTVLGGMMVDRTDINHLLGMTSSQASLRHAIGILARHAMDRLSYSRGTRLVMGNALVGRLLFSLSRHANVTLALNTTVKSISRRGDVVDSVTLDGATGECSVAVRGGVVLASGGFNRDAQRRAELLPGADAAWCPGAPGHTGEAQRLASELGAHQGSGAVSAAFWAPVSLRKRADGSTAVFPHFVMDRAKPGMLTVNQAGQRFVNESTSYHLFGFAMQQAHGATQSIPAYLVCDADALRKYGIGMVRPGGKGLKRYLAEGYLTQAPTLAALARALGIDAAALQATVERFNSHAASGVDPDFQRGTTAYQRNLGDPAWPGANPCLGPLTQGPFYAVRLYPGDIGAATGLATDAKARVLDGNGTPLAGLYAAGNDMHSIMGGVYTAPGITIGPGLVFGCLAARHAAGRARGGAAALQA
jgi:succinate dehydrogenase/fumarate reductase flavoprotein subunit